MNMNIDPYQLLKVGFASNLDKKKILGILWSAHVPRELHEKMEKDFYKFTEWYEKKGKMGRDNLGNIMVLFHDAGLIDMVVEITKYEDMYLKKPVLKNPVLSVKINTTELDVKNEVVRGTCVLQSKASKYHVFVFDDGRGYRWLQGANGQAIQFGCIMEIGGQIISSWKVPSVRRGKCTIKIVTVPANKKDEYLRLLKETNYNKYKK